jgi:putative membrane protein
VQSRTSNYGWHPGRFLLWGFIAFLAVIGTIAAVGFLLRPAVGTYYPFGWGFFPFGFFFAFFWIMAIFWFVRFLFWPWRWGMGRRYWGGNWGYGDRAYYILRERYARGEITKDQYDQMMRDLQQHNQAL